MEKYATSFEIVYEQILLEKNNHLRSKK